MSVLYYTKTQDVLQVHPLLLAREKFFIPCICSHKYSSSNYQQRKEDSGYSACGSRSWWSHQCFFVLDDVQHQIKLVEPFSAL
mmetsp:Transcript_23591/g.65648  ORF Transcript_23591/g.65648 Transcript_23591/m.65648 type:complete len:83 (+) Transcript_23591:4259-4507(+)